MAKNKIIVIGYLGGKTCYLNVKKDEAIRRYLLDTENGYTVETANELDESGLVKEIEFRDEFCVYDAYESADGFKI